VWLQQESILFDLLKFSQARLELVACGAGDSLAVQRVTAWQGGGWHPSVPILKVKKRFSDVM
jgi:hypothetical protein